MIHVVIVRDPKIFQFIKTQTEAKKVPIKEVSYKVYSSGNIRIVGEYDMPIGSLLSSVVDQFNPDTVFFLSESYPVSDEKLSGDIVLPNVFFPYNHEIESVEMGKDMGNLHLSHPIFLEHYPMQGDYDFETFGLSVGGIHVSGDWNTELEDFRIRLRVVYENDTFDSDFYQFLEAAKTLSITEKMYPVAYIGTEDISLGSKNLWSIVGFIIGSIDPDLIPPENEAEIIEEGTEISEEEWVDGNEKEE